MLDDAGRQRGSRRIPSGSFVTMPLIFAAVRLPAEKIPILLTVDWLLDRLPDHLERAGRYDRGRAARPSLAARQE